MISTVTYEDTLNGTLLYGNLNDKLIIVMPAHNEEKAIYNSLNSIRKQKGLTDLDVIIFIALDNCTDGTEKVIRHNFSDLNIKLYKTVNNKQRKAGALNQVYRLLFGDLTNKKSISDYTKKQVATIKAFVGVDADVMLGNDCLATLYKDLSIDYRVGAVSANYTCLLPESKHKLLRNVPDEFYDYHNLKYGNPFNRWLSFQQSAEFAQWTLKQKASNYFAEIAGGQCSIFKPEALRDIYNVCKLNGIYDNATDTEDLNLTQQLRKLNWNCIISDSARCYVDSMDKLSTYISQRFKWVSGTLDYALQSGLGTKYSRILWGRELLLVLNFFIRCLMVVLIPASVALGMFTWNWIWITPYVLSIIINSVISMRTPRRRFIDVLLNVLGISPELYLWLTLYVHAKVWLSLLKVTKVDGWQRQYLAEQGKLHSTHIGLLFVLIVAVVLILLAKENIISFSSALAFMKPYINSMYNVLTTLTLITMLTMLYQLLKLRGNFKA